MKNSIYSIITGTGSYIPTVVVKNSDFLKNTFLEPNGEKIDKSNEEIIAKFQEITEIEERRFVEDEFVSSDIGYFAALEALKSSNTDKEELDYIIVAHNFGDIKKDNRRTDIVPTLASRIKYKLGIQNPNTIPYDLPFGCPGWLQGIIQADYYIKSGDAKKIMVIGTETLSRISDPYDRDSMLYSDGAGAVILEAKESSEPVGIIAHKTRSDTSEHAYLLRMDKTFNPDSTDENLYLKMNGRKLYEYALNTVPQVVKDCIEKAGILIDNIKKVLIHQANAKMDHAMLKGLFKLFKIREIPQDIMPMSIYKFGNNSVATLPILLDLIRKQKLENHVINQGDYVVFASVGAGINVNAMVYRMQ
jgi:3-oxoacyl-[acyl-carrier-protein] synthase III